MNKKIIEDKQLEQQVVAAAKSFDVKELDAYVDAINAVNARVPNDVRYLLRHRDAAIAVKVIGHRKTMESHMPLVMNGGENATCTETLQWLKTYGQKEGGALERLSERLKNVLKEVDEKGRPAVEQAYEDVRMLEKLHASLGEKLEQVAELASALPYQLSHRKSI